VVLPEPPFCDKKAMERIKAPYGFMNAWMCALRAVRMHAFYNAGV
jgi:hypothetical protein